MRRLLLILAAVSLGAALSSTASASWKVEYGLQDDAWLEVGTPRMSSLDGRLAMLDRLGVGVVRYTVRWDHVAPRRPEAPADPDDPAYDWSSADALLAGLHAHRIDIVLTVWGTPPWASGRLRRSRPPKSPKALAQFVTAAAKRYPWVHKWEIWNEPNQVGGLNPNSPRLYVERLLNPAVAALHAVDPRNVVAGGATSPRATRTALSAVAFLLRDEPVIGRWSSGFFTAGEVVKPSFFAFMLPLAEISRRGGRTMLWGQVRPRSGPQPYLLQRRRRGRWVPIGSVGVTGREGFFAREVFAGPGSKFRIWSLLDDTFSPPLTIT